MANVKLSKEELELVTDAGFILTKNRIIGKVYEMFGELATEFRESAPPFPPEVSGIAPKISRGENYLGLPWVMMDYPRRFTKSDVFAVRCFFWWGNFFSITLQLAGEYQQRCIPAIGAWLKENEDGAWWLSNAGEPWSHHFGENNYRVYIRGDQLDNGGFVKLAKKIPLQEWDNAMEFYRQTFIEIRQMSGT